MESDFYEWSNRHSQVLIKLLECFNSANIRFFLLRNYKGLPEINPSKDVDILVDPKSYKIARKLLLSVFIEQNFTHYFQADYERAHCFYAIDLKNNFSIHIDLIAGYSHKGFEILTFDFLYGRTIKYKNFLVLDPALDAVMLLLYKLIMCKQIKDRYREEINTVFCTYAKEISNILDQILGLKKSAEVIESLQVNNYNSIEQNANSLSRIAKQKVFFKYPFKTTWGIIKFLYEKTVRMIICPKRFQYLIAVEAPDGVDTTRFLESLTTQVARSFVTEKNKCEMYNYRPNILPNIGILGERIDFMRQNVEFLYPYKLKPLNKLISFMRFFYYWLDYVIGIPYILRKSAQFYKITIFDHYIYDILIDPKIFGISLPYWLRRLFSILVIQPKLVFLLETDIDTMFARNPKLSKCEKECQLSGFRESARILGNVYVFDATKTTEEKTLDAVKIIWDRFAHKLCQQ